MVNLSLLTSAGAVRDNSQCATRPMAKEREQRRSTVLVICSPGLCQKPLTRVTPSSFKSQKHQRRCPRRNDEAAVVLARGDHARGINPLNHGEEEGGG
jgi:hypothetical protein